MRQINNLKLWVGVVGYAAGIAVGARLFGEAATIVGRAGASEVVGAAGDLAVADLVPAGWVGTVVSVLVFVCLAGGAGAAVYWFGAKRNPRVVSAYLLIVAAFGLAGVVAGARVDLAKVANQPWATNGTSGKVANGANEKVANEPAGFVGETRSYVRRVMGERLPADEAGLMMGVLLGDTSAVPAEVKADFRTTGLSHILAVSGLNVTILITASAFIFSMALSGFDGPGRVTPGRLIIFGVTAAVIVFYMALCGFAPSIVRAGVMGLAALSAPLAGRQTNVFAAMAAAAMGMLIIDPATLFDVGFQLSFLATVSIILFAPHITRRISATPDSPSGVAKALAVTISAQLGVAPILAANFGSLSIITPAANTAVTPAVAPAQLLGIVIPMLNLISEPLAAIAAYPAHICLAYTMAGASFFAKWPFASVAVTQPQSQPISLSFSTTMTTTLTTTIYIAVLAAFYFFLKNREPRTKLTEVFQGRVLARTIMFAAVAGVLIIGTLAYRTYAGAPPDGLRVTFMDVGQGDSTLIQANDGATILIDGGPEADSADAKLRAYGVQRIDLLIITHPHADHVNGLPAVVRDHAIEKAIIPPDASQNNQYLRTIETLTNNKVAQIAAREGQNYKVGRDLTVKILSPDGAINDPDDANNQAVVALVTYKGIKMLFTGDIELATEEDIIADGEAQKIDILKVPHHGSKTGADTALMEILKPKFAIISVGANNRYHHPAPTTLSLLRQVGASVFRTDKNGSVTIESDGKTIRANSQK